MVGIFGQIYGDEVVNSVAIFDQFCVEILDVGKIVGVIHNFDKIVGNVNHVERTLIDGNFESWLGLFNHFDWNWETLKQENWNNSLK